MQPCGSGSRFVTAGVPQASRRRASP
jgi:hypothetical protein